MLDLATRTEGNTLLEAAAELDLASVRGQLGPRPLGRLESFDGLILEATGLTLPVGSAVTVEPAHGRFVRAEVVGFRGQRCLLMCLDADPALVNGSLIRPDSADGDISVGMGLLGRIVDALGEPLDGLGPVLTSGRWPLHGRAGNPLNRASVTEPFDVGVRAINALLTAGIGQRVAIIAGSGVGKSVLMGQIMAGSIADVIVVGLIGERGREVSDFVGTKLPVDVRAKTAVVAVPADHAPMLRLRAAMRATAIAEHFRSKGLKVLLLLDSLTRVAHAQREIGLSLGEPPTVKGYPPSALGLIPRLVERAGNDESSGGSITAIYTVLADGDDTDDPIVDAARAIVDGHIVLSRSLAEQSVYPAIDIGKSLSRVMSDVAEPDHVFAAREVRRLWSAYESNRDLILMGAYAPATDADIDEAIAKRAAVLAFLSQEASQCVSFEQSRVDLAELVQS